MKLIKKSLGINISIGTILSLIIAYFIYLYAKEKEWALLAFIAKVYLLFYLIIAIIFISLVLIVLIVVFIGFLLLHKKLKSKKTVKKKVIDAEYKIIK